MRTYKNIDSLKRAIARKEDQLERTRIEEAEKFSKIPWGYGMRAYSRLKHMSTKSIQYSSQLQKLEDQLKNFL